jgi:ATP-dependent protease HslVU (ClpYQ) ATPase subunit
MKTENVQLTFDDDAIKEIARISAEVAPRIRSDAPNGVGPVC